MKKILILILICSFFFCGCGMIEWIKYGDGGNPAYYSLRCPKCDSPKVTITDPQSKDPTVLQGGHPWHYKCHKCGYEWDK